MRLVPTFVLLVIASAGAGNLLAESDSRKAALTSLVIPGKPVAPRQYHATRGDDRYDVVDHEYRRDLRVLRASGAWLGHDDSKALNSLDILVEGGDVPYVKHRRVDCCACPGSAPFMAKSPHDGNVCLFAGKYPGTAFRSENPADRVTAAHKINAFSDEEIRAIVSTGQYSNPAAEEWIPRSLMERRNQIACAFLSGTDRLEAVFAEPAFATPPVKVRWMTFDKETGQKEYLPAEIESFDGPAIPVYIRMAADHQAVVGLERQLMAARRN